MFKALILLAACLLASEAAVLPCNRGHIMGPFPIDIRISTCPDHSQVCRIIRGTSIDVMVDFEATSFASTLVPEVRAHALGTTVFYELPSDRHNACQGWIHGTSCPLSQGEFATYNLVMPITEQYPLIPLNIEVRLFDQANNIQFCFSVESEVVLN